MNIPKPIKIAAVAAGASYVLMNELEERYAVKNDFGIVRKLYGYRKNVVKGYAEDRNICDFYYETLDRVGEKKKAIIFCEDDESTRIFTFGDLEAYSNQIGNFLIAQGLKPNDSIALFMENRPEFIATWLGASKVGVRVAMINTSIVQKGLAHCVNIANAKAVFYGIELESSLKSIVSDLSNSPKLFACGGGSPAITEAIHVDVELKKFPKTIPNRGKEYRKNIGFQQPWGYIYTSGTTGLPKAAVIPHSKIYAYGGSIRRAFDVDDRDILYTCLPLFHSAGGGLGAGMVITEGITMVLRKKFSAKSFFMDCAKHNVTAVQYIGELCRYLVASPPNELVDKRHKVRIAIGNGLRPEIWPEFQKRFNLAEIGEFYGSTEGNGALFNHCKSSDAIGYVGRVGSLLMKVLGLKFAKYDVANDALLRGPDGFCVEAGPGEPGELLLLIKPDDPATKFSGYSDSKATEKKIVRNAFKQGDMYFSTGDLLSRDARGFIKFVDRIGDTFRWKGENCSTTEVTEVVSVFPGVEEANVYGVLIPNNQDGRAPCAAITPTDGDFSKLDLKKFAEHCQKNLPSYAVPMFIRITPQIAVTATLKHQKGDLRGEGIDIAKVKDPLYYLSPDQGYIPLSPQVFAQITKPNARL